LYALEMGRDRFGTEEVPWVVCTKAAHYSNRTALRTLQMHKVKTVEIDECDAMDVAYLAKNLGELPVNANAVVIDMRNNHAWGQ
jgi:glutamate/tyrosine decarboxylase-like PLP-dependent enzyme